MKKPPKDARSPFVKRLGPDDYRIGWLLAGTALPTAYTEQVDRARAHDFARANGLELPPEPPSVLPNRSARRKAGKKRHR